MATRDTTLRFRVTEEERDAIRLQAEARHQTVSDYIRDQALRVERGGPFVPRPKPKAKVALEDERASEPGPVARIWK